MCVQNAGYPQALDPKVARPSRGGGGGGGGGGKGGAGGGAAAAAVKPLAEQAATKAIHICA